VSCHPFNCTASASKKDGLATPFPHLRRFGTVCETGAPGPLVKEALVALKKDYSDRLLGYCTSMVIVWLAATRSWSFVAPFTVIWCVPLLTPLNAPEKPF
jgi:hypothetical protein